MESLKNGKPNAEMNVLWTKEKLRKNYSRESLVTHVHGSGDGGTAPGRCCRLCGGDTSLRNFADTCVWEGVEERFDQKLYECFGIMVSPSSNCMICEWCVRQLKTTERFRALVHAAFDKAPSEVSSKHSIKVKNNLTETDKNELIYLKSEKESLEILNTNILTNPPRKRREPRSKTNLNANKTFIRTNIACSMCKQKYPMIVSNKGVSNFVCSRCKKNNDVKKSICRKCNIVMPTSMIKDHLELHVKADLRGKSRLRSLPNKPLEIMDTTSIAIKNSLPKYQCTQCPKRYVTAQNLTTHVQSVHKDTCACVVCGRNMKTRKLLVDHLKKEHTGDKLIFPCEYCMRIFRSKQALQTHSLIHEKRKRMPQTWEISKK